MKPKKRPETDRRVRQSERLARVLRVFQLIQSRGGPWNAPSIAKEIDCSERTVYRDLQVLTMAGVPWYFDELCDSYRVTPGFKFSGISAEPDGSSAPKQTTTRTSLLSEAQEASRQLQASAERVSHLLNKICKYLEHTDKGK
jgi:predicted DNA-binding transcriptional regulator YafY